MARSRKKQKAKQKRIAPVITATPERLAMGSSESFGLAGKFKPTINLLLENWKGEQSRGLSKPKCGITEEQHVKLAYYREQALLAEKSTSRDSCDFSVRGGDGNGPSMAILSAISETYRLEAQMGPVRALMRFCVVEDHSVRQWCLHRFGGVESGGRIRPVGEFRNMGRAYAEIRLAADRLKVGRGS